MSAPPTDARWSTGPSRARPASQRFAGETLVQEFRGDEGARRVVWTLLADGDTLRAQVVMSSRHLPRPVEYTLTYRRKPPAAAPADGGPGR
ncbi:MAG TPA: hypothetical protein VFN91_03545 [Myxococcaceae bacterium]|nr:hypothetical protein [Myxococcaceae bacterium]